MGSAFKRAGLFYLINDLLIQQVTQWKNITTIFRKIDFLFKDHRRYAELDTKEMIAWLMMTFNSIVPGQETIRFHIKLFIIDLHDKWRSEVNDISITNIRKLSIRKPGGVFFPKVFKTGFPKKINKM